MQRIKTFERFSINETTRYPSRFDTQATLFLQFDFDGVLVSKDVKSIEHKAMLTNVRMANTGRETASNVLELTDDNPIKDAKIPKMSIDVNSIMNNRALLPKIKDRPVPGEGFDPSTHKIKEAYLTDYKLTHYQTDSNGTYFGAEGVMTFVLEPLR